MCRVYCKELPALNRRHPDGVRCDTKLVTLNKSLDKVAALKLQRHIHMHICEKQPNTVIK
jgi:methionine synthase II (cobalamin-independent)